ncbi:Rid family detoxifying hydrolase [Collimonas sp.]|jgi:2-iminobutanoate/2-iminopropanoate deaminase|uniref:Rid family detoxifying hydrolase n=1 Tax=Collimonas sp. TaxID=1963772 RepID=UPI002C6E7E44|nr:Rid family detoxifying hydrolase [Collimonas sp.]HWW04645.1 Rid family detoxifying hydrolase [Collimonas sp.]
MTRLFCISTLIAAIALGGCANLSSNELKFVAVPGAPKAVGPYSQGVVSNGMLFTAGYTPRDPVTGKLIEGDIVAATNRVIDNLEAVLLGAGCSLKDVVKVTVYMTDLADFAKMNEAMAAKFGSHKPARTTIQVEKIPGGATLAMDFIARVPQ